MTQVAAPGPALGPAPTPAPGPAPTPAPPDAPAVWYRRVGLEARNVTITIFVGFLALALLVGAVILVTALAVR